MMLWELKEKLEKHNIYLRMTDVKYQRGYKSRRNYRYRNEEVLFVPQTSKRRSGQAYILAPSYHTTRYCIRIYFNVYYDMLEELGIL